MAGPMLSQRQTRVNRLIDGSATLLRSWMRHALQVDRPRTLSGEMLKINAASPANSTSSKPASLRYGAPAEIARSTGQKDRQLHLIGLVTGLDRLIRVGLCRGCGRKIFNPGHSP